MVYKEDMYLQHYRPDGTESLENLSDVSRYLLQQLREPLQKKMLKETSGEETQEVVSIANVGELMFSYVAAGVTEPRQFIYDLEHTAVDKFTLRDNFSALNSTKLLWGLARFRNRDLVPSFADDPGSCILSRDHLFANREAAHRLFDLAATDLLERNRGLTAEQMCLTSYAMASVGYYSQEFFEKSMLSYVQEAPNETLQRRMVFAGPGENDTLDVASLSEHGNVPHLDQLSMLAQSAALYRRPEYASLLIGWLAHTLNEQSGLFG